jgi:RimJ/RimL family protein N-acetyltransferase
VWRKLLKGKLVQLRAIEISDLGKWQIWFNDSEVMRYMSRVAPYSYQDAEKFFQQSRQKTDEYTFSIVTLKDNTHIGSGSLKNIDFRSRHAEFSILIGAKEMWGRGYGTDASQVLCAFAFEQLGLNRVYLNVKKDNIGGINAYLKVGFKEEGVLRQHLYRDGAFHDLVLMSFLAEDYKAQG